MKPSKIKPGTKIAWGTEHELYGTFIERIPRWCSRPAQNIIEFPALAGLDGYGDKGVVVLSDYEVSRHCRRKPPAAT